MSTKGTLGCTIASPDTTASYEGLASVGLPAASGYMQILPGHAEAFILLGSGDVILKGTDGVERKARVEACECHVAAGHVAIIC